jgi:hypothetical protein
MVPGDRSGGQLPAKQRAEQRPITSGDHHAHAGLLRGGLPCGLHDRRRQPPSHPHLHRLCCGGGPGAGILHTVAAWPQLSIGRHQGQGDRSGGHGPQLQRHAGLKPAAAEPAPAIDPREAQDRAGIHHEHGSPDLAPGLPAGQGPVDPEPGGHPDQGHGLDGDPSIAGQGESRWEGAHGRPGNRFGNGALERRRPIP